MPKMQTETSRRRDGIAQVCCAMGRDGKEMEPAASLVEDEPSSGPKGDPLPPTPRIGSKPDIASSAPASSAPASDAEEEPQGCQWVGKLENLDRHLRDECEYTLVSCPHTGCDYKVRPRIAIRSTLVGAHVGGLDLRGGTEPLPLMAAPSNPQGSGGVVGGS
eukprot:7914545-Pyramimonas_sp.AAC.2